VKETLPPGKKLEGGKQERGGMSKESLHSFILERP